MALLPLYKIGNPTEDLWQTQWKSIIDPALSNPIINGLSVDSCVLQIGINVINHKLGRKPIGWFVTDQNAGTTIFRSQPFNDKTLTLTVGADVTISLWVY